MQLSLATNFDPLLIDGLRDLPVVELYGKLREDPVGGGRASYQLAPVTRAAVAAHVARARAAGIDFNYLLNAACMGNREITRAGQRELDGLLGWVCDIGVRSVTVSSPLLLRLIKTRFPQLRVRISVFAGVDRVLKARQWEELGADSIVLDSLLVNRELETLRQIRKAVRCELELLVNNSCLQACALSPSHMTALAHASQSGHASGGFLVDYDLLRCTRAKIERPIDAIRADWIRPEDLAVYEELGYDRFKIVERDLPTSVLLARARAYAARSHDGNLLDLVQPFALRPSEDDGRYHKRGLALIAWIVRFALRPLLVNPLKMLALAQLAKLRGMLQPVDGEPAVYIDNRALDGFLERFRKQGCRDVDCDACGWCEAFARRAVRVDPERRARILAAYDEVFRAIDSGALWRYGKDPAPCSPDCSAGCRPGC